MTSEPAYTDLLIRIGAPRGGGQRHAVEAEINADRFYFGGSLELDQRRLLETVLDNAAYGTVLREALFSEPIARAWNKASGIADQRTAGRMRVRLQIDPDAAALHALRWERLSLPVAERMVPLSTSGLTPFSRFIARAVGSSAPLSRRPIRMAVLIANPRDLNAGLAPIKVAEEVENLALSLAGIPVPGTLQVTVLPGHNGLPKTLRDQLTAQGFLIQQGATTLDAVKHWLLNCDLLHILSHGVFLPDQGAGRSALFLEQTNGDVELAKEQDIVRGLGDGSTTPRLVFLAACESARRPGQSTEAFIGLGPRLVQAGVPAVIGMQDRVPMTTARQLTATFYHGLLEHGIIDQALNDARLPLLDDGRDWSIPVLFTRLQHGRLFVSDPLRALQRDIAADCDAYFADKQPPLPLDVVRAPGALDHSSLVRLQQSDAPGGPFEVAARAVFPLTDSGKRRICALVGAPGMAKSSHLRHFAGRIANQALDNPTAQGPAEGDTSSGFFIPVFTHLRNLFRPDAGFKDSFRSFLLQSLRDTSPSLDPEQLDLWLKDPQGPRFLFLIDGSDRLDDARRASAWERLDRFAQHNPRHAYLLVCDLSRMASPHLRIDDFLIARPLTRARLKTYLDGPARKIAPGLFRGLETARLFDLASQPWVLVKILSQIGRGLTPRSRTGVLQELVHELIAQVPRARGQRSRARPTLRALAWHMQSSRLTVISIGSVLRIMDNARDQREYLLDDLLAKLMELRLLAPVGDAALRFAYPGLQAWFAAQALATLPDREQQLDDITATLGRVSRLRWWEDTLVLLAGSTGNINALLQLILYGGPITEGDRIFLAARCLQESGSGKVDKRLHKQLTDSLIWLSRAANEPRTSRRQRAIHSLGQLHTSSAIPHLISLVLDPIRTDWQGKPAREFSSVRLAAVEALRNMARATRTYIIEHQPAFAELLKDWLHEDIAALERQLLSGPVNHRAISAFTLGDIGSVEAAEALLGGFRRPGLESETRWAITDALLKMEPVLVTDGAILPFIDRAAATRVGLSDEAWKKRSHWYERVIYLIGRINPGGDPVNAFLQRCLQQYKGVWLKARTLRALGAMGAMADSHHKALLEQVAAGDFSAIAIGKLSAADRTYLRSVAIDALAGIGDRHSLTLLQGLEDWADPELQAAYYRASDEIAWRLFEQRHAETAIVEDP